MQYFCLQCADPFFHHQLSINHVVAKPCMGLGAHYLHVDNVCVVIGVFVMCERCSLVLHTCPLTGEFGIVYKAQLTEMRTPFLKFVAVKTLKGYRISHGSETGKEHCVNCKHQC